MQKSTALDRLIRSVESKKAPHRPPDETIVPILLNPHSPFWKSKEKAYFLVSNYRESECGDITRVPIEDLKQNWSLDLLVKYRVRVPEVPFEAAAQKIAEKLYDPLGPQHKLESIIRGWVHHFADQVGGPSAFMGDFVANTDTLEESIRRWALDQLSLDLRVHVAVKSFEDLRTPFSVKLGMEREKEKSATSNSESKTRKEWEFATSNSESTVGIGFSATVKIEDASVLARRFPRETNLADKIAERVKESFRLVLQTTAKEFSPKEWYLNFDTPSDPLRPPLKEVLEVRLRQDLKDNFGGVLLSLDVTRDGTLLDARNDLKERTPRFDLKVTRAGYDTEFAYRVLDVIEDMWHRFEATKPSIQQLNERISLHIQQLFADDDPAVFRSRSNRNVMHLLNDGTDDNGIKKLIAQQYGLKIYIDHWIRKGASLLKDEDGNLIDLDKKSDEVRWKTEDVVLDEKLKLLEAIGKEKAADIELKQSQKEQIRKEINALHPIDQQSEIATLEARLAALDLEIKKLASDQLRHVIDTRSDAFEHGLALSLGQTPLKLLKSGAEEKVVDAKDVEGQAP
jgi:hypothetical protein